MTERSVDFFFKPSLQAQTQQLLRLLKTSYLWEILRLFGSHVI
jgi:hypothetical protein